MTIDGQGRVLLCGAAGAGAPSQAVPVAQRLLPSDVLDPGFAASESNGDTDFTFGAPLPNATGYLLVDTRGYLIPVDFAGVPFGTDYQILGAQTLYPAGTHLYVSGFFATVLGSTSPCLQRLLSDGLPDPTWHSGLSSGANLSRVQALADGRVLAVGLGTTLLTADGAIDLNDPIVMGALAVATADGALTTLGSSGTLRRFVLQALPAVSLQASVPTGRVFPGTSLILTASSSAETNGAVVWSHNGMVVTGVTGNQLTVASVTGSDGGWYSAGVPTAQGLVYSTLWVGVTPYAARIANASARIYFTDTQQSLTTGSVIQGSSTEPALLRILGPSLAAFGLTDLAAGFSSSYYANGHQLVYFPSLGLNYTPYVGPEPLANTLLLSGAFPSLGLGSEVQLRMTLSSGVDFTTSTEAVHPGAALFELYLPEPATAPMGRRLTNFSCRSAVGAGERILILGLTIEGTEPLPILVRGIGPGLQAFGVASPVNNPLLQVFSSNEVLLGTNDHWQNQANAAQIAAAAMAAQAFPLSPGAADAALLLTLPPGGYSAVLSAQTSPGQGMIEVYEVGSPN